MREPMMDAELATRVFQLITEGKLRQSADLIHEEMELREPASNAEAVAMVAAYHRRLPMLPKVCALTPPRRRAIKARLREHKDLAWWDHYFHRVSQSSFLTGSSGWKASFDWLMKPANVVKVIEGNYDPKSPGGFSESDEAAFRMSL